MKVGHNIMNHLEAWGISQTWLANKIGVSRQNLNRMLYVNDLKLSQYLKICEALGVKIGRFIDTANEQSNQQPN